LCWIITWLYFTIHITPSKYNITLKDSVFIANPSYNTNKMPTNIFYSTFPALLCWWYKKPTHFEWKMWPFNLTLVWHDSNQVCMGLRWIISFLLRWEFLLCKGSELFIEHLCTCEFNCEACCRPSMYYSEHTYKTTYTIHVHVGNLCSMWSFLSNVE